MIELDRIPVHVDGKWTADVPRYLQLNAVLSRVGLRREDVLSATLTVGRDGRWTLRTARG